MNQFPKIKAVILDLGGVIIELHYARTLELLKEKSGTPIDGIANLLIDSDLHQQFEIGSISENDYYVSVCDLINTKMDRAEFDSIFNSILGTISKERMEGLAKIMSKYQTFVLSNTNSIHERAFNEILYNSHGISSFREVVDEVYFSHKIRDRKPNLTCYESIINEIGVDPQEILFIDDREDNCQAAEKTGIQTFQNVQLNDWLHLVQS